MNRLAVADKNLARRRLVPAIAQQRDEGRHEQHVEGADRLEAAQRLGWQPPGRDQLMSGTSR